MIPLLSMYTHRNNVLTYLSDMEIAVYNVACFITPKMLSNSFVNTIAIISDFYIHIHSLLAYFKSQISKGVYLKQTLCNELYYFACPHKDS